MQFALRDEDAILPSWELPQEAHIVLKKDLDIVDAILEHGHASMPMPKAKPLTFFGGVKFTKP